jgi:hypothetical protein
MKQGQSTKRPRVHRGNGRRPSGGGRNSNFESSGPQGKIRGTAYQVIEKYQALGRDALTFGDRVAAENYFQHAEHYYRVMAASGGAEQQRNGAEQSNSDDQRDEQRGGRNSGRSQSRSQQQNQQSRLQPSPKSSREDSASVVPESGTQLEAGAQNVEQKAESSATTEAAAVTEAISPAVQPVEEVSTEEAVAE